MKMDAKLHRRIRIHNLIFTLLFLVLIGLLAWLSTRYSLQMDWTTNARNTLSTSSQQVLDSIDEKITVTAYARDSKILRDKIGDFIGRYSRYQPNLEFHFVNPDTEPEIVKQLGITVDGELIIEINGRIENVRRLSESAITNALYRIAQSREHWVMFLSGHGERSPSGEKNHDIGQFGAELKRKGLKIHRLNLALTPNIPDNASLLVIASPLVDLLPGEVSIIEQYVQNGGNLFWLHDPGKLQGLEPLAKLLGIEFLPGTVVEAESQAAGINNPSSFARGSRPCNFPGSSSWASQSTVN